MKKTILIAVILPLFFSCSKTWHGCTDHTAINFSEKAEKDDDSCLYTTLTFYADSTQYPAAPVDHIEITIDGVELGTFSTVYSIGGPANCSSDGTVTFGFEDAGIIRWSSKVFLIDGTSSTRKGDNVPDRTQPCILINVL